ncbi:MAG: hypothetical protein II897_05855 [Clostridia bacterium]|nr:hypothetical protein [Clostridia bacterium]
MNSFNNGKLYINSSKYFHDLDNEFQGDFEGGVFYKKSGAKLIPTRADATIEDVIAAYKGESDASAFAKPVEDLKLYVSGFIICFFIVSKDAMRVTSEGIEFNSDYNAAQELSDFLGSYSQISGFASITVYDAMPLMNRLWTILQNQGFDASADRVVYEDLSLLDRTRLFQNHEFEKLVFTKDKRFAYQKEFRVFLQRKNLSGQNHIEVEVGDLHPTIVCTASFELEKTKQGHELRLIPSRWCLG